MNELGGVWFVIYARRYDEPPERREAIEMFRSEDVATSRLNLMTNIPQEMFFELEEK